MSPDICKVMFDRGSVATYGNQYMEEFRFESVLEG